MSLQVKRMRQNVFILYATTKQRSVPYAQDLRPQFGLRTWPKNCEGNAMGSVGL